MKAGILDEETASKIRAFENTDTSFSVGQWIVGLGVFAIGVGLIALVASNWSGIPPMAKIAADLVLLATLGWTLLHFYFKSDKSMLSDLFIGILFFFTLASLALVGQIYQLDVELYRSLLTWLCITTPLMLMATSGYLATLWALVCAGTYLSCIPGVHDALAFYPTLREPLTIAFVFAGPLLLRFASIFSPFRQRWAAHTKALGHVAHVGMIVGAIVCSFPWYTDNPDLSWDSWVCLVGLTGSFTALAILFRKKLWPNFGTQLPWIAGGLWSLAWISLSLGLAPFRDDSFQAIAALFQFGVIVLLIVASLKLEMHQAFQILVGLACLRVLIVYFEVFGTLLNTGLALISGGVVTIGMAALWRVLVRRWSQKKA